ncbi:MAG: hypothetical protein AAGF55_05915 [Pseudomonadota bacterium]
MNTAEFLLMLVRWWGAIGAVVAFVFLTFGVDRLDEDARGAYVFRPLIIPGILLLWPLVLWRWYVLATGRDVWAKRHKPRRHTHRLFAYAMPVVIVAIVVVSLSARQQWPDHIAPQQLAAPEAG